VKGQVSHLQTTAGKITVFIYFNLPDGIWKYERFGTE
jgi:hypothetical protein